MAERKVQCRCCKKQDIDKSKPETYVQPAKGWYYHINCYQDWIARGSDIYATAADEEWKEHLWSYLTRDVKIPMNWGKFDAQWTNFLLKNKKKMTAKGIYYSVKYFYGVMHGDAKDAEGGIGIVPYIYDDSCTYWSYQTTVNQKIYEELEKQIIQQSEVKVIQVNQRKNKKQKKEISLSDINLLEDEE